MEGFGSEIRPRGVCCVIPRLISTVRSSLHYLQFGRIPYPLPRQPEVTGTARAAIVVWFQLHVPPKAAVQPAELVPLAVSER